MRSLPLALLATATAALSAATAQAAVVLTFEGVGNGAEIREFYNGGADSQGNVGPDRGISFVNRARALLDRDEGGNGNFANEPTNPTVLGFRPGGSTLINVADGFDTGFALFYSSAAVGSINIFDGLNGTGTLLGSIAVLSQFNGNDCVGDPTGVFCNFTAAGTTFAGTARSIVFVGLTNNSFFDNLTFGSATPAVPDAATWALMLTGFAMVGAAVRRRGYKTVSA